jgi:pyruvate dehydrogenase E2 component (dihydrolipoamide acetyltransferase)
MIEVAMPRLSDSMEEGTIIRWLAPEGAAIEQGQELVEIETDKASMIHESDERGVLQIIAGEGDTLPVGAPIARLLAPGEEPPLTPPASVPQAQPDTQASAPPEPEKPPAETEQQAGRVKASPLARRLASAQNLDLAGIQGSGPGGRIVRADVERAASPPKTASPTGVQAKGQAETVELSRTQALIARRMAEAKATIPEFTLQRVVDMRQAVGLREELKALTPIPQRPIPSFNDMVVRACSLALREHPRANASYRDGRLELHPRINVGIAVAVSDALLVPVVHDADERSLWEIAQRSRELAVRAREGTITPPELSGGTFSVSNLGMYGIDSFTAVINPPQAAILAVGSLAARPFILEGELAVAQTMTLTLTCDHRVLYGADAAEFLDRICVRLQQPLALLG